MNKSVFLLFMLALNLSFGQDIFFPERNQEWATFNGTVNEDFNEADA